MPYIGFALPHGNKVKMRVPTVLLASLLALRIGGAEAQSPTPPASVYVTCYGPVPGNVGPRPDKVYFAGVSTVPVTLSYQVKPAFIAYAKQTYGADFDPRCDFSPTEAAARDYLKAELNVLKDSAVETGWMWTPSPADPVKPAAVPAKTAAVPVTAQEKPASAPAPTGRLNYGYCYGIAGNPRAEYVTRVFVLGAQGLAHDPTEMAELKARLNATTTRESGCSMFATAEEALARRMALVDGVTQAMGPQAVVAMNWVPQGAKALSAAVPGPVPVPTPTPTNEPAARAQDATPVPAPKPTAPASAAATGVFVVCNGVDLGGGKLFFNPPIETTSGDATAWSASYAKYLQSKYKYDRNIACSKFATRAEADSYYKETSDSRRSTTDLNGKTVPLTITTWTYP